MRGVVAPGVDKIVENIGRLPPDIFAETCQQILNQLQGQTQGVDVAEISDRFQKAGVILDLEDAEDIIKLLSFNFRLAAKNNLTAEQLVTKLDQSSSGWPKCALQTVRNMWSEQGAVIRTHQEAQVMMSVGQLVDVKWKLGMAVSSDNCRSLNSPYVSLLLKVADTSGQITHKSFEMTVPQFQNFFRQFKEIATVLETV
ncbi:COMM domain-containing protein 6 isoform X1 [Brienomyrus brachyistius]|uniref:COMM domain-containing protein 6 isoform X1 n=1 Tax=Brienomyrus brachyistius TaxID=42636 RepID=UPI0020B32408|nr:COMM domain-containing protein 6 isoform X1 [Brienomyrus brachyistius]